MIDLYSWTTPNGFKATIMLEECGLAYRLHPVNIGKNEQFAPDFLKISPNNKIPALVDSEGPGGQPLPLFESGAILIYLADKTGRLLPAAGAARYTALQWLMFQMGARAPSSPAATTPSPTSPSTPGSSTTSGTASTGPITRRSKPGSTASASALRCKRA